MSGHRNFSAAADDLRDSKEIDEAFKQAMTMITGPLPGDDDHPGKGKGVADGGVELTEEQVEYGVKLGKAYITGLQQRENAFHVALQRKIDLKHYAYAALPEERMQSQAHRTPGYVPPISRIPATWTPPRDLAMRLKPGTAEATLDIGLWARRPVEAPDGSLVPANKAKVLWAKYYADKPLPSKMPPDAPNWKLKKAAWVRQAEQREREGGKK